MQAMQNLAYAIMLYFLSVLLALIFRLWRGGRIVDLLRDRHRDFWEENGRLRPGLWGDARSNRFDRFIMQREYLSLPDPWLSEQAEALRIMTFVMLVWFVGGLVVLSSVGWIVKNGLPFG